MEISEHDEQREDGKVVERGSTKPLLPGDGLLLASSMLALLLISVL